MLENLVDVSNVGAVFRNAAALNVDAVLLAPHCADHLARRAIRVSMGTVFQVPWAHVPEELEDVDTPDELARLERLVRGE